MARNNNGDRKKEKSGNGGKAAGVGIIAALLLLGGGYGYSTLGPGFGSGAGDAQKNDTYVTAPASQETQKDDNAGSSKGEIPETIIVSITEDSVTINGNTVADKETLKNYIREYNSDTRKFVLKEDKSILAAHDWVLQAFSELEVTLSTE